MNTTNTDALAWQGKHVCTVYARRGDRAVYMKRTGGRGGEGTGPGREEMPRPDSRREGGGGKRRANPLSESIDVVTKKNISKMKEMSAVELALIPGTFLLPFAIIYSF